MLPNPRLTVSISRLFLGMNFPFPRLISDEIATNGKVPQIRRLRRNCLRPKSGLTPQTALDPQRHHKQGRQAQNFDQGNFLWFFRFRGYFSIFLKPTVGVKRGTVLKITALPVGLSEMPEMTLEDLDSLASAALRRRTNMTWETFNRFKDDTRAICFLEHYERDDGEYS